MEPSVRIEVVDWFTWMGVVVVSATSYGVGEIGGVAVAAVSVLGRGAGARFGLGAGDDPVGGVPRVGDDDSCGPGPDAPGRGCRRAGSGSECFGVAMCVVLGRERCCSVAAVGVYERLRHARRGARVA